jgi:hypothetical protein
MLILKASYQVDISGLSLNKKSTGSGAGSSGGHMYEVPTV